MAPTPPAAPRAAASAPGPSLRGPQEAPPSPACEHHPALPRLCTPAPGWLSAQTQPHPEGGMQAWPCHQRWPTPWDTQAPRARAACTSSGGTRAGPVHSRCPCATNSVREQVRTHSRRQEELAPGTHLHSPGTEHPPWSRLHPCLHSCERREQRPCSGHTAPSAGTGSGAAPPCPTLTHGPPGRRAPRVLHDAPWPRGLRRTPSLLSPAPCPAHLMHSLPIQPSRQALLPYWSAGVMAKKWVVTAGQCRRRCSSSRRSARGPSAPAAPVAAEVQALPAVSRG